MMEAAAVASWHSVGAFTRKKTETVCGGVKAGWEAAVLPPPLLRAVTWLPGRTWTGPWAELVGGAEAEPVGPLSACWGRVGALDV